MLHRLKGREHDHWWIWVNANWRMTFEFQVWRVYILDYEDDHSWLCTTRLTPACLRLL